jgi:hypothetical protein
MELIVPETNGDVVALFLTDSTAPALTRDASSQMPAFRLGTEATQESFDLLIRYGAAK